MSRSLSIEVLLPIDSYNSGEVYESDDKLCRVYGDAAEPDNDKIIDEIIDYESSMDGKLIINLIIGREIARRVGGRAIAYYD